LIIALNADIYIVYLFNTDKEIIEQIVELKNSLYWRLLN